MCASSAASAYATTTARLPSRLLKTAQTTNTYDKNGLLTKVTDLRAPPTTEI
jgi:hypothetical protein